MNDVSALEKQVGGDHYSKLKIQPVEFIATNGWDFLAGSVFKYVTRYKDKNGRQDIEKAIHFLQLRNQLYSRHMLECLNIVMREWIGGTSHFDEPQYTVEDYVTANSFLTTDHRYKALMLLGQIVYLSPHLVHEYSLRLIDYLKFVADIEYPIDNSTKS